MNADWDAIHKGLIERFPDSEIKSYSAGRAGLLSYIDARAVFDRLDAVVGPGNWSTRYRVVDEVRGGVECTLTIHGVERADVGYPNNPLTHEKASDEPYKDAYSDAIKRAAVQWGVGRFLYSLGTPGNPKPGQAPRPAEQHSVNRTTGEVQEPEPGVTGAQHERIRTICMEMGVEAPNVLGWSLAKADAYIKKLVARQAEVKAQQSNGHQVIADLAEAMAQLAELRSTKRGADITVQDIEEDIRRGWDIPPLQNCDTDTQGKALHWVRNQIAKEGKVGTR